jgi:uncharacterized protein (TIGR02646 family)
MIKINKPFNPPEVRFAGGGAAKVGQLKWRVAFGKLIFDFRADPGLFVNGKYKFIADFGRTEYSTSLRKCQGNKCCFCEKPVGGADIEHFRPKAAWQQAKREQLNRPGYYWLAYSWDNMLISCTDCNSKTCKGNLFPVNGARSVFPSNCNAEASVLINPAKEDPSAFISFRLDQPYGIDPEGRGNANIEIFNLKTRGDILEPRRDRLKLYQKMGQLTKLVPDILNTEDEIRDAKVYIGRAQAVKSPFAGMIRENLKNGLI